ncbi:MAG: DUF1800 domain-containing protein [Capsulimonadales bacterium]|nr:DUF1800 domain-containing protein [Capsulimonadales bacterium]
MSLSRRDCLRLGAAGAVLGSASTLTGCSEVIRRTVPARERPATVALPPTIDPDPIVRLLNRAGFGPVPGDVARVATIGITGYLDEQLNAPEDDSREGRGLQMRLGTIEALTADPYDLNDLGDEEVLRQLSQASILRAVYSPFPLRERMVDFWSNHFNLYARKRINSNDLSPVFVQCLVARDSLNVIRRNALGKFPAMLKASARSPAMLTYLDNQKNRKGVANENYAREIMELHSLGVNSGYTQKDVQEVARCLTGWTVEEGFLKNNGAFRFDPALHDDGEKVVLGHRIPAGGGESDGDTVLDILASHPWTARFIARKMVKYLHGVDADGQEDAELVSSVEKVYTTTGGDIAAMVRHILTAPQPPYPILKRPFDFVVSALRASDANTDGSGGLIAHLQAMGQPLYEWPMPDGYPDKTAAWTGSLLARWNFALALFERNGKVEGTTVPLPGAISPEEMVERFLGRRAGDPAVAPLVTALGKHAGQPAEMAALVIASPAFQWR